MTRPNYEQKANAAYLIACSSQAAYEWLKWSAPKNSSEARGSLFSGDSAFEEYLLFRRSDRLIDLGIARFGRASKVVRRAFLRANAGTRVAAWSNVAQHFMTPAGIWATKEDLATLAAAGSYTELAAFATNPSLREEILQEMMLRKGVFAGIPDLRYALILNALGNNPRMAEVYGDDRFMDGYAEYTHGKPVQIAWSLAGQLPTHGFWPATLERLLTHCRKAYYKPEEVWPWIERWRLDNPRDPNQKRYYPGPSFHLRSRLADLLKPDNTLFESEDLALRLSYYRRFSPVQHKDWEEDLRREYNLGEADPIYAAMENPQLWVTADLREKLRKLAWSFPDEHSDMLIPNAFQSRLQALKEKSPQLFADEDVDAPSPPSSPPSQPSDEPTPTWVDDITSRLEALQWEVERLSERASEPAVREVEPVVERKHERNPLNYIAWWVWLAVGAAAGGLLSR